MVPRQSVWGCSAIARSGKRYFVFFVSSFATVFRRNNADACMGLWWCACLSGNSALTGTHDSVARARAVRGFIARLRFANALEASKGSKEIVHRQAFIVWRMHAFPFNRFPLGLCIGVVFAPEQMFSAVKT